MFHFGFCAQSLKGADNLRTIVLLQMVPLLSLCLGAETDGACTPTCQ